MSETLDLAALLRSWRPGPGPGVQRLLDRLADTPVAVFDASWTRLEQNDLWAALTGDVRGRAGRPANIVRRIFNHDPGRVRNPSPDDYKASLVAGLRYAASRYPAGGLGCGRSRRASSRAESPHMLIGARAAGALTRPAPLRPAAVPQLSVPGGACSVSSGCAGRSRSAGPAQPDRRQYQQDRLPQDTPALKIDGMPCHH
jgi:hypothetical protein